MAQKPLTDKPTPSLVSSLWFSFDSAEEDKELWILEQEVQAELERVEQKHSDTLPVGKSGNEGEESQPIPVLLDDCVIQNPIDLQSYVDEDEDEDEEEDDNDDEESESHDDDDDEEIDMDVEDHDSPTF